MCGIVGSIALRPDGLVDLDAVHRANACQAHRGPDDVGAAWGRWHQPVRDDAGTATPRDPRCDYAIGHRRLAIIDTSSAGHQPMVTPDGRSALIFNGEIYNYVELRAQLARTGVEFRSGSDTEVLLEGLVRHGAEFVESLIGMFAFAFVDGTRGTALLGRDQLGIKPLHYTVEGSVLHFASELKALRLMAGRAWTPNPITAHRYLRFGVSDNATDTFVAEVQQLPAAHTLLVDVNGAGSFDVRRYWRLRKDRIPQDGTVDAADQVRDALRASVALHMRSDVPVGVCLSGGLDSTALAALMREHAGADAPIHAFSFISPRPDESEERWVDLAVRTHRLLGHKIGSPQESMEDVLVDVLRHQEQPFGSLSIVAQHQVFRLVHDCGIKVVLDGQGSDEVFGGYIPAVSSRMAELIRAGRLPEVGRLLRRFAFATTSSGRARALGAAIIRLLPVWAVDAALGLAGEPTMPPWLNGQWFRDQAGSRLEPYYPGRADLREELIDFVESRTLPSLLRFEDRNSMRWSVESRVPFCTPQLAELAMSLPSERLVSGSGETKAVLRQAMTGIVPQPIIDRSKIGFLAPDADWLGDLDGWMTSALADGEGRLAAMFNWPEVRRMLGAERGSARTAAVQWRIGAYCAWARQWDIRMRGEGEA